jgi:hypothetical protein
MSLRALLCGDPLPPPPNMRFEMADGLCRVFVKRDGVETEGPNILYFSPEFHERIKQAREQEYQELREDDQAAKDIKPWYQRTVDYFF